MLKFQCDGCKKLLDVGQHYRTVEFQETTAMETVFASHGRHDLCMVCTGKVQAFLKSLADGGGWANTPGGTEREQKDARIAIRYMRQLAKGTDFKDENVVNLMKRLAESDG